MQLNKVLIYISMLLVLLVPAFALEQVLVGSAQIDGRENKFLEDNTSKLAMLIPVIMLIVALVFFAVDFGVIGVTATLLCALIFVNVIGLLAVSVSSIVSRVIMGAILLYKLAKG